MNFIQLKIIRKYIILIFVFSVSPFSNAQNVIFQDTFDDDHNNWAIKDETFNAFIKNGKLNLINRDAKNYKWKTFDIGIKEPQSVDFDIEATLEVLKGKQDVAYGLVWSITNDYKWYRVINFMPNKQMEIFHYNNGNYDRKIAWTDKYKNNIGGKKELNKILVQKRANIVKVFINNELVYQSGGNSWYGSKAGFIMAPDMEVAVDDVKITEYPLNIKVVTTFNPNVKVVKLSDKINTPEDYEGLPRISADGKTLYFCKTNHNGKKIVNGYGGEDVWYSEMDENGDWKQAQTIGRPINNDSHNFVISVSTDNNTLFLSNRYKSDGSQNGGGISKSNRTHNGWEVPKDVIIEDFVNKSGGVGFSFSFDNKFLVMSIEDDKSLGRNDLYVSHLKENGEWSKPKNMGNVINTFEEEQTPFLAADGKTLYFVSQGHPGYGYSDFFVSKRLDDTWTNWSEPENLGNIINTSGTEWALVTSAKGDKIYFGRDSDIYEIDNSVKQDPVILVKGKVLDSKTKKPLSAPVVYNDLKTNKELGTAISDPSTGNYSIVLPYGTSYSFLAEQKGYYSVTENLDVSNLKEYKELEVNLYLNPIEKGQIIRLNNIFFDSGKYDLLPESNTELDRLYSILKENKNIKIEISGHTDNVGDNSSNLTLSNNRAKAVMNYLVGKGIEKERLTAKGYGETKFIAKNDTEQGKQLNRRVEFSILDM